MNNAFNLKKEKQKQNFQGAQLQKQQAQWQQQLDNQRAAQAGAAQPQKLLYSQNQTSQNPTSQSPTTQNPTSQSPTSQNPASQSPTTQSPTSQNAQGLPAFNYQQSDNVTAAYDKLNAILSEMPQRAESSWQTQLNDTINKILNREQFSYDLNGDALYQQYKDNAIVQGNMAMMDTMGQAAAMTGGYGNSYAQGVGQQAYAGQLQNLNDMIPELRQMAYDMYKDEGQQLSDQYGMLSNQEEKDYLRYQDELANWRNERDYLQNAADSERTFDYGAQNDAWNAAYGMYRDTVSDSQWDKQYESDKEQREKDNAYRDQVYADDLIQREKDNAYRDQAYADDLVQREKDNAYRDQAYADDMTQREKDNAYRDQVFNADQEQLAKDNAYRDQVYADDLAQRELDNAYRDQVYADEQAQLEKDNAYRDLVYSNEVKQQELDNIYRDKVYADEWAQQEKDNAYRSDVFEYGKEQDKIANKQWQAEFDAKYGNETPSWYAEGGTYNPDDPNSYNETDIENLYRFFGIPAAEGGDRPINAELMKVAKEFTGADNSNDALNQALRMMHDEASGLTLRGASSAYEPSNEEIDIDQEINTLMANGASDQEIKSVLKQMWQNEDLDKTTYDALMAKYFPRGVTR